MSTDKYWVYRPLLDLIGHAEGTDRGDRYNETLAYGQFTDGDVNLVEMSLRDVDRLQTKMLDHPDNSWNSSAIGRYQIVRTTLRSIKRELALTPSTLFNEETQDRMACYLLGVRGIDKHLAGRMKEDTLINNLAKEWASFPTMNGKGHYGGQNAAISVDDVRAALKIVKQRHRQEQPARSVAAPPEAEKPGTDIFTALGSGASLAASSFAGLDWRVQLALVAVGVGGIVLVATDRLRLARSVRRLREALEE